MLGYERKMCGTVLFKGKVGMGYVIQKLTLHSAAHYNSDTKHSRSLSDALTLSDYRTKCTGSCLLTKAE